MESSRSRAHVLGQYFAVTWLATLVNMIPFLKSVDFHGPATALWALAVYLTYGLLYLLPPLLLALALHGVLSLRMTGGPGAADRGWRAWTVYGAAVLGFAAVQMLIVADVRIHEIFGYHFNGFVWNILMTPGGIDSLGGDDATTATVAVMSAAFVVLQTVLLLVVLRAAWFQRSTARIFRRRCVVTAITVAASLSVAERMAYALAVECEYTPVVAAGAAFPLYKPTRMRPLARMLGIQPRTGPSVRMKAGSGGLRYPLAPVRQGPHERWNVVWLACESLRADALDAEIMPATWKFAQASARFEHHYSAGNGTRMGMFGMFYGLYGPYWFPFLEATQGPVVLDVLRKDGYQMSAYTSASFTYPEFDRTIFAQFPADELHAWSSTDRIGWQSDRKNVTDLLAGIDRRDRSRPFFTFMFFESPHARYHFPPESVVRTPYLEEMNYATMDLQRDIELIRNRYLNACHHLDSQLQRIYEHLEAEGLLNRTIVIVTGDHGEEFLEKGRWGHNSAYSEEQTRPPLLIRVPGRAPEVVTRMTSHLDIPPTLLTLLGVENPPADYCLGYDLFGTKVRDYTVIAQWNDIAFVDRGLKAVFPFRAYGYTNLSVTTNTDAPVEDRGPALAARAPQFAEIARDLGRFAK